MSQESGPQIPQEPLEEELLESLLLARDGENASSNEELSPDADVSLRPDIREDLANANIHYGSRNEGEDLGSWATRGPDAGALGQISDDLGPLNGKMSNGEVFLDGDRYNYYVSDLGHGNFTIRDITSDHEINITRAWCV